MIVLFLALSVALLNLMLALGLERWSRRFTGTKSSLIQAAGYFIKFAVIFGAAHILWQKTQAPVKAALFIILTAVLQTAGQTWVAMRHRAQ